MAIGDSNSEGVGDRGFDIRDRSPQFHTGWTDRLARLIAQTASDEGHDFRYANLSLRGSKLRTIMTEQLWEALKLQPDLVTVMAGSNDIMTPPRKIPELERIFRDGVELLLAAGCRVVVATTINPSHLGILSTVANNSDAVSAMVRRVARDYSLTLIDVHSFYHLAELKFWSRDLVHFSEHGHIYLANLAAELLELPHRMKESEAVQESRGPLATLAWLWFYVFPFIGRRIRRTNAGVGRRSKHDTLIPLSLGNLPPNFVELCLAET